MRKKNPYHQKLEHVRDNDFVSRFKRVTFATVVFVASYIAVVYIDRLAVYAASVSFGYEPKIMFWNIEGFPMKHIEWSKQRVMLIFSIGSFSLFVTAMIVAFFYKRIAKSWLPLKLFSLWLFFNCFSLIGANIAPGIFGLEDYSSVYFNNLAVILVWWGIPIAFLFILLFLYCIILFIIGFFSASRLLRYSHSGRLVSKYQGRLQVISAYYILPMVLGALMLIPFSINNILFLAFHCAALLLMLMGMFARINDYYELHGVYRTDLAVTKLWLIVVLAFSLALPLLNR